MPFELTEWIRNDRASKPVLSVWLPRTNVKVPAIEVMEVLRSRLKSGFRGLVQAVATTIESLSLAGRSELRLMAWRPTRMSAIIRGEAVQFAPIASPRLEGRSRPAG